jgi:hypothetical protein
MRMLQVSQFWLELAAGKPLGPAWARKDAQNRAAQFAPFDELPMADWMRIDAQEQRRVLRAAVALEAAWLAGAGGST